MDLFLDAVGDVGDSVLKLFNEGGGTRQQSRYGTQGSKGRKLYSSRGSKQSIHHGNDSDTENSYESTLLSGATSVTETLVTTGTSFAGKTQGTSVAQSTIGSIEGLWLKHQRSTSITRTDSQRLSSVILSQSVTAVPPVTGSPALLRRQCNDNVRHDSPKIRSHSESPRRLSEIRKDPMPAPTDIQEHNSDHILARNRGRSETPRRSGSRSETPQRLSDFSQNSLVGPRDDHEKTSSYTKRWSTTRETRHDTVAPTGRKEIRSYRPYTVPQGKPAATTVGYPARNTSADLDRQVQFPSPDEPSHVRLASPDELAQNNSSRLPGGPRQAALSVLRQSSPAVPTSSDLTLRPMIHGQNMSARSSVSTSTVGTERTSGSIDMAPQPPPPPPSPTRRARNHGRNVGTENSSQNVHSANNSPRMVPVRQPTTIVEADVESDRDDGILDENEDPVKELLARVQAAEDKGLLYLQELQALRKELKEWEEHGMEERLMKPCRKDLQIFPAQVSRTLPWRPDSQQQQHQYDRDVGSRYESNCLASCVNPLPDWLASCGCLSHRDFYQPMERVYYYRRDNNKSHGHGGAMTYEDRDQYFPNKNENDDPYAIAHPDHLLMPQLESRIRHEATVVRPNYADHMYPYEAATRSNGNNHDAMRQDEMYQYEATPRSNHVSPEAMKHDEMLNPPQYETAPRSNQQASQEVLGQDEMYQYEASRQRLRSNHPVMMAHETTVHDGTLPVSSEQRSRQKNLQGFPYYPSGRSKVSQAGGTKSNRLAQYYSDRSMLSAGGGAPGAAESPGMIVRPTATSALEGRTIVIYPGPATQELGERGVVSTPTMMNHPVPDRSHPYYVM